MLKFSEDHDDDAEDAEGREGYDNTSGFIENSWAKIIRP